MNWLKKTFASKKASNSKRVVKKASNSKKPASPKKASHKKR
jgi:hypothetical protein